MQVVKKMLISFFVLWFAALLFMPKKELYYALEEFLEKQSISINEKHIEESIFTLKLHDVSVYVKGIKIMSVDKIRFFTLFFYTTVKADNILVDESFTQFIPERLDKAKAIHTLLNPIDIRLSGVGSFGLAEGMVNLKTNHIRIDLSEIKKINNIRNLLKKDEKGLYYETSF